MKKDIIETKKPLVIPIMGKAKNGKDTLANYMREELEAQGYKTLIIRNADYLKMVLVKYFDWNGQKDENGRQLLQQIGTDLCRKNNPNVWVKVICELVKSFGDMYRFILIPDTRFPNEIDYWGKEGFSTVTVRVVRKNADNSDYDNGLTEEQKMHPSETALNDYKAFYTVEATSLEDLQDSAKAIVEEIESL